MAINYVRGDATQPRGDGPQIIAHVCNDIGAWGRGLVTAISKRWPQAERAFRAWHTKSGERPFALGEVQFVEVAPGLWVANMISQHGIARRGKTADGLPPIRYDALEQSLRAVAEFARARLASVHMPRIGCGLAGGTWERIEPLIERAFDAAGVNVSVHDL